MKIFIIYDSKYGNTKIVAQNISFGAEMIEGNKTLISNTKEVNTQEVTDYDVIVLGSPNHMANPSRTMQKFVRKLAAVPLKTNSVAVFGTYSGRVRINDRAVRKMEKIVEKTLPNLRLLQPSLSVRVKGVTGPVANGELLKCQDFGKKIAMQLSR